MSATFGTNFKISFFGESHGEAIGLVIDGLKPGLKVDFAEIEQLLQRRHHSLQVTTKRKEPDKFTIMSGILNDITTGAPLMVLIKNQDVKSKDYQNLATTFRPSHVDYPAYIKYHGYNDYRGGGMFSGRLTALFVIAGYFAKHQLSFQADYQIASTITKVLNMEFSKFPETKLTSKEISSLNQSSLPFIKQTDFEICSQFLNELETDSVGGEIQTVVYGVPIGIGEPFFNSLESVISQLLFSIPAIKGVSFGLGDEFVTNYGSQVNDQMSYQEDKVVFHSNHSGGINGGISNGQTLVINTIVKPPSSIAKKQSTIDIKTKTTKQLEILGRHDKFIVPRAIVVIESAITIALANFKE